jgi:hypothetical protein
MIQKTYNPPRMALRRISDDDGAESDLEVGGEELETNEGNLDDEDGEEA